MPPEKYVKNGYFTEEEFIYTIQETASELEGINALELTLGLKQLQILKKALSRRLRKNRIFLRDASEYVEKVAFYLVLLMLKEVSVIKHAGNLKNKIYEMGLVRLTIVTEFAV